MLSVGTQPFFTAAPQLLRGGQSLDCTGQTPVWTNCPCGENLIPASEVSAVRAADRAAETSVPARGSASALHSAPAGPSQRCATEEVHAMLRGGRKFGRVEVYR